MTRFLRRSLRSEHLPAGLQRLAFTDDLTGLYNREGFLLLGSERMKMASGIKRNLLFFFVDLDNLKEINERFGSQEGDRALVNTGEIFKKTFRNSDITSRFGGDEFTALVVEDMGQSADAISRRLKKNLNGLAKREDDYPLSLSIGVARYVSETPASLKKLLAQAAYKQDEDWRVRHAQKKSILAFPPRVNSRQTGFDPPSPTWAAGAKPKFVNPRAGNPEN